MSDDEAKALLASAAADAAVDDVLLHFMSDTGKYSQSEEATSASDAAGHGGEGGLGVTALLQRADDVEERLKRHENNKPCSTLLQFPLEER